MASTRAAIYCRISKDAEREGLGVARQERECRELAKRKGWRVVDVYTDNDLSASKRNVQRPEYQRLLEDIAARKVDAIVAWDMDRLHRQPKELEAFVEVCMDARLEEIATVGDNINIATGDGLLVARIKGAVAAEEARKIGRRVASKMLELARDGRPAGGKRPIGFAPNKIDHDPREARALRRAAKEILAGSTIAAATRPLSEAGILPERPDCAALTLKRVLTSPRVAGLRQYRGEVIGEAVWKPIIERGDWERLRALLLRPGRYSVPHGRHLLTGFARCTCGSKLSAQIRKHEGGRVIYSCRSARGGCGHVGVDGARLEEHVRDVVSSWLRSPAIRRSLRRQVDGAGGREAELLGSLAADEKRLTDLAAQVGTMAITTAEWAAMRQPILDRLEASRAELAGTVEASRSKVSIDDLRARWEGASIDREREVLRVMGVQVTVAPVGKTARRFNQDRVTVVPSWGQPSSIDT